MDTSGKFYNRRNTPHEKKSLAFFSCSMLNIGRTVNRSFIEIYPVAAV